MMRGALVTALSLATAACGAGADPATPALWRAECPGKGRAWMMGTVHALEKPADWHGKEIDAALAEADLLMVELADPENTTASAQVWKKLSTSPGHGPLSARVTPDRRGDLAKVLNSAGLKDDQFGDIETWAAALTLAQAASPRQNSANGIDRAVIAASAGKRIEELEGRQGQLSIFDTLPEQDQRDLLEAVIAEALRGRDETADLAAAWRTGDMAAIERETERGMLADPELREALFTGRNRRWIARLLAAMQRGDQPFVAVGAAHLAGPQGMPALLREQGCGVVRIQ